VENSNLRVRLTETKVSQNLMVFVFLIFFSFPLQNLQDREKEHKHLVLQRLSLARLDPKCCQEIESNFKNVSRNILSLAFCLSSQKELKEFFVILVEKILESFKQMPSVNRSDLDTFLRVYTEAIIENVFGIDSEVKLCFKKYMLLMRPAILVVFR
jgi:hypothetical protein